MSGKITLLWFGNTGNFLGELFSIQKPPKQHNNITKINLIKTKMIKSYYLFSSTVSVFSDSCEAGSAALYPFNSSNLF